MTAPMVSGTPLLQRQAPFDQQRLAHFQRLYTRPGYVEVVAGRASAEHPDRIELLAWRRDTYEQDKASGKPHTRSWLLVDPARPETFHALDRTVAQLTHRYGNVYTSVAQYSDASRHGPQPARVVLVEDSPDPATLPLPPSWAVQTSPRSWQAYYLLDRDLLPYECQRLARGLARAFGADLSGTDAEQLTRPPATRNTKAKCGTEGFAVRLVAIGDAAYTVAQIEALFSSTQANEAGGLALATSHTVYRQELDTSQIESYLQGIGAYLKEDGLPRRLSAKARGFWQTALLWQDTSAARWALALSLLRHRYPLELATALLYHLTYNRSKRGRPLGSTGARWAALHRLLARRWEDDADPLSGRLSYQAEELAELLGIGARALRGYLQALAAQGKIERGQQGGPGGRPWLRLLPAFWVEEKSTSSADAEGGARPTQAEGAVFEEVPPPVQHEPIWVEEKSQPALATPEVKAVSSPAGTPTWMEEKTSANDAESTLMWVEAASPIQGEQTSENADQNPQCIEGKHTAPAISSGVPVPAAELGSAGVEAAVCSPEQVPCLRDAVAEALAAITARKRTRVAVWIYISRLYGSRWSPEAVEHYRSRLLAAEPYDAERAQLAALADNDLYAALRASERYTMRREYGSLTSWHRWRASAARDELQRRGLPAEAQQERRARARRAAKVENELAQERSRPLPTIALQQVSWEQVMAREEDELLDELAWARRRGELPPTQGLVIAKERAAARGGAGLRPLRPAQAPGGALMRLPVPLRLRISRRMRDLLASAGPNTSAAARAYLLLGLAAVGEDLRPLRGEVAGLLAEELEPALLAALERCLAAMEGELSEQGLADRCIPPVSQMHSTVPTPLPEAPVQPTSWDDAYEV